MFYLKVKASLKRYVFNAFLKVIKEVKKVAVATLMQCLH